ncbi:store-operated calcium entry regulator STIMATE-like [Arctopsyche grandis]|uniref:store-operated calcium entry regulator STIMATE-like n=1 Tax=Arctopsyche grandis TaxID=121162 RepID=UPI00406DA29A
MMMSVNASGRAASLEGTQWSNFHCSKDALTNTYGWFLQVLLAGLAFTCLIGKRFCEPRYTRRSWLVWFYDTSKQGMGAFIIHMANVWLASQFIGDPCTWYIINFMLDSTLGLLIIWAGIRVAQALSRLYGFYLINFGEYGKPASACAWGCQCALYALIMIVMKASIGIAVWFLSQVGVTRFVLSPFTDQRLELAVIMLIIPFFVNILMFWVTDNFLMYRPHPDNTKIKTKVRYRSIKKEKSGSESEDMSADERLIGATA